MANKDFATRRREFLHRQKQLADVISGRQRPISLSNQMRFLAEQHLENIARNSTASPEKRRLMMTHFSKYVKQIPLYLEKKQATKAKQSEKLKQPKGAIKLAKKLKAKKKRLMKITKERRKTAKKSTTATDTLPNVDPVKLAKVLKERKARLKRVAEKRKAKKAITAVAPLPVTPLNEEEEKASSPTPTKVLRSRTI